MTTITPSTGNKIILGIGGTAFTVVGLFLYPKLSFQGYFEILPIVISGLFIFFGLACLHLAFLYKIIFDESGITTGSSFYNKTILNREIEGFFIFEEKGQKKKDIILQLAILKHDGTGKVFLADSFGSHFELIKETLAKKHKQIDGKKKSNFLQKRKNSRLRIGSYFGIALALFGIYLIFSFLKPDPPQISLYGTLVEQPSFTYNKRNRPTRINLKLNEYPGLTFSEVGNIGYLEAWALITAPGDKISLKISEADHEAKIKKTKAPDKVILNYGKDMIEIKSLTHRKLSSQPVYRENNAEGFVIGIFFLLVGLGAFFYYQRDIRTVF